MNKIYYCDPWKSKKPKRYLGAFQKIKYFSKSCNKMQRNAIKCNKMQRNAVEMQN